MVSSSNTNYSYPELWGDRQGYGWVGPGSSTSFKSRNGHLTLSGTSLDTLYIIEWINNSGGGSSGHKLKATDANGTSSNTGAAYTWGNGYTNDYVMFGGGDSVSKTFMGKITELLFYTSEQTSSNLATTQGYFETNYGVSFS